MEPIGVVWLVFSRIQTGASLQLGACQGIDRVESGMHDQGKEMV
jgi:hypothetical protein